MNKTTQMGKNTQIMKMAMIEMVGQQVLGTMQRPNIDVEVKMIMKVETLNVGVVAKVISHIRLCIHTLNRNTKAFSQKEQTQHPCTQGEEEVVHANNVSQNLQEKFII